MPVSATPLGERVSETTMVVSDDPTRVKPDETFDEFVSRISKVDLKAKYKIEVMFSKHRSSLAHKPSPLMLTIWESGKKYHGGGDQKMYWCGYDDCDMPLSSDHFAAYHCVCPSCNRELFLDDQSKAQHRAYLKREGKNPSDMDRIPVIAGEKLANLIPSKLAELLEKTWRRLEGDADIYLKYSPFEIRYDPVHEPDSKVIDLLDKARIQRQPVIYPLKNIMKDIHAGADLRKRFLAMITS